MENLTKKITFKAWNSLHDLLKKSLRESCIQRDQYLDIVLKHEAKILDQEVSTPNSDRARSFLKKSLLQLDLVPISLALSEDTVNTINDVCTRKHIPRDSFINRVLLFLILGRKHFGFLLDIDIDWFIRNPLLEEYGSQLAYESTASGLSLISQSINEDPFWTIRQCIDYANQDEPNSVESLHNAFIDKQFSDVFLPNKDRNLTGLNCIAKDYRIDGSKENEEWLHMFDEFLKPENDSVKTKTGKSS